MADENQMFKPPSTAMALRRFFAWVWSFSKFLLALFAILTFLIFVAMLLGQ